MRNWFPTLNDALEAEGLVDRWPVGLNLTYDPDYPPIDQLFDMWAEAGGTAAHPSVKAELYRTAAKHGVRLPGMRRIEE